MGWNKDGSTVKALYLSEYLVTGVVTESRVKYGGDVSYWLKLDEPLVLPAEWSDRRPRTDVLVNERQIIADFGILETV